VPLDYEKSFQKALLTFKFQVVYCPDKQELVHLNNPESHPLGALLLNYTDLDFLGQKIEKEMAMKICKGEIDPITRQVYKETVDFGSGKAAMKVY
jgi:exonuclease-1